MFVICFSSYGQTIHLLIVASTTDVTIGEGCQVNIDRLKRYTKQITDLTEISVKEYIIKGNAVSSTKILTTIQTINCQKNDIIWFYYSGHGTNAGLKWPKFLIQGAPISLEKVHNELLKKKPRLLLSFADCCNFTVSANNRVENVNNKKSVNPENTTENQNTIKANIQKLFNLTEGEIIVCSSEPGEFSVYNEILGGFFTMSFFEAYYQAIHSVNLSDVTWQRIFSETNLMTNDIASSISKKQTPQNELLIRDFSHLADNSDYNVIQEQTNDMNTYIIKSGDNYWSIARNVYKIPEHQIPAWVAEMQKLNKNVKFEAGEKLIVKPFKNK